MADIERRSTGEFRLEGRTLTGRAMTYGDVSPGHRERFEAGAFGDTVLATGLPLNIQHDAERIIARTGAGLELRDAGDALHVRSELRRGSAELHLARRGVLRGLSVEFTAVRERADSGVRVIEAADLRGIGLVDSPSYPGSIIEVRAGGASGSIPYDAGLSCECHDGGCDEVVIEKIEPIEGRDVLAVAGNYQRAIASRKRGTLALEETEDGLSVELSADALATPAGRELAEMSRSVPIYARPIFDQAASEFIETAGVAKYSVMRVKAILVGPTDNARGWPEMTFGEVRNRPPGTNQVKPAAPRRRRRWR